MAFEGTSKVLLIVKETQKRDDPNSGFGIWLIGYYDKDGKPFFGGPKIVCGTFSTDPGTGEKRYYAKGMNLRDFDTLRPRWKEAEAIMKNPPPLEGQGDLPNEPAPF
jgi:hypothetical protein